MAYAYLCGVNIPTMTSFKPPNVKSLNTELGRDTQLRIITEYVQPFRYKEHK